jgi:radical SAM protein (TIGR01212 family)
VDAGFSCPNRDGRLSKRGCVFCEPDSYSPARRGQALAEQLRQGVTRGRAQGFRAFAAYFQPYTNTYAPIPVLRAAYDTIRGFPEIVALAIGTRPDCVDEAVVSCVAEYAAAYEVWLELGLQSVHDETLRRLERRHSVRDFYRAVELARGQPQIKLCVHVMLGLPGEGPLQEQETAKALARLGVEGVKLHPLHVVRGTALADWQARGVFTPLGLADYAERVADFLERLPAQTVVHRLTADCPAKYLLAPDWLPHKAAVLDSIRSVLQTRRTRQGSRIE